MISVNKTMKDLLNELVKEKIITDNKVYNAMLETDRADFSDFNPYQNLAQSINFNAVISQPLLHAVDMELLKDHIIPGSKVLDVGSGSGYLCVSFSKMMNDKGLVVGVEHIKELVDFSIKNISKNHKKLLDLNIIKIVEGDGRLGVKEYGPYNAINVGAVAPEPPKEIIAQLANGGRLIMPLGYNNSDQYVYVIDKDINGNLTSFRSLGVRYVPLGNKEDQLIN
jgi:protein-L-isoaspartate(D-aspartate) O-methyltransferase